jgi:hypothetical protein
MILGVRASHHQAPRRLAFQTGLDRDGCVRLAACGSPLKGAGVSATFHRRLPAAVPDAAQ